MSLITFLPFFALSLIFCQGLDLPKENAASRIVGGELARMEEAPWQAAMLLDWIMNGNYGYSHSGVIIRKDVVLTSGTAGTGILPSQYRVRAGTENCNVGGQVVDVVKIIVHPRYNSQLDYDLSIYMLEQPLILDGVAVAAASLPLPEQTFPDGAIAMSTGYGTTSTGGNPLGRLTKVYLPIVSPQRCSELLSPTVITPRMLCAGGGSLIGGPCHTDGGGPFTINNTLIGVASFNRACGTAGLPSVWANVAEFRHWIDLEISHF